MPIANGGALPPGKLPHVLTGQQVTGRRWANPNSLAGASASICRCRMAPSRLTKFTRRYLKRDAAQGVDGLVAHLVVAAKVVCLDYWIHDVF